MNALETTLLSKRFARQTVLEQISFVVPTGSICAILGENGSGKTTLIRILLNLLAPSGGSSSVLGVDSQKLIGKHFESIGYVAQDLFPEAELGLTTCRYLNFCSDIYPRWNDSICKQLCARYQIPSSKELRALSIGTRKKVAIIAAISAQPQLLALDEPFSDVDNSSRQELTDNLLEILRSDNGTVLIASHDIAEIERIADRILILNRGELIGDAPLDELYNSFRKVTLSSNSGALTADFTPPQSWLNFEVLGSNAQFIHRNFNEERLIKELSERQLGSFVSSTHPLSLKEIYSALIQKNLIDPENP